MPPSPAPKTITCAIGLSSYEWCGMTVGARTRVIRDFRHIAAAEFSEIPGRIVTDQGRVHRGAYALELTGDARRVTSLQAASKPDGPFDPVTPRGPCFSGLRGAARSAARHAGATGESWRVPQSARRHDHVRPADAMPGFSAAARRQR